jgi:hypothetical protein
MNYNYQQSPSVIAPKNALPSLNHPSTPLSPSLNMRWKPFTCSNTIECAQNYLAVQRSFITDFKINMWIFTTPYKPCKSTQKCQINKLPIPLFEEAVPKDPNISRTMHFPESTTHMPGHNPQASTPAPKGRPDSAIAWLFPRGNWATASLKPFTSPNTNRRPFHWPERTPLPGQTPRSWTAEHLEPQASLEVDHKPASHLTEQLSRSNL